MIPILYDKTGTNKLGDLNDILDDSSYVEEARNGIFELTLDYPNDYPLADQLIEENFIEVKPNDKQSTQKFRIYDTKKLMENVITVFARHESFDLVNDHVESVNLENASCEYALNTLFRNSHFSQSYRGYSDIVNAQNFKIDNVNILSAIAGKEGSIIDTYGTGAEILRDGKNIHILNKRGHDNGVTIEYGKNLTGFELDIDLTGLETRCGGFAKYRQEGSQEDVIVKSDWIDSPFIDNFAHPYISVDGRRDYSDKFKDGEIPTKEKLNKLCQDEFKINKRDIPANNYKINFIPLSKCVGYESVNDEISLCDTATIIDPRFNINTKSKVISYKYDFIKERYMSMELGEPRTTLGDIIGGSGDDGKPGPQGPQGPPGQDGNMENFPNTLPSTPVLSSKVYGFSTIELSWTFENKVYYQYELYASKTKDFKPNTFDLIHAGQTSSFLFQAKPNETWYFRVCAINTHGNRTAFSSQVTVTTKKVDDLSNYVDNMAIGEALIGELSLDRGWVGKLNANYLDVKGNFSVTDGNGKRTLDIDSFGNVTLDVNELKIKSSQVATTGDVNNSLTNAKAYTDTQIQLVDGEINQKVSITDYDKNNVAVNEKFSQLTQTVDGFKFELANTQTHNEVRNSSFANSFQFWSKSKDNSILELWHGSNFQDNACACLKIPVDTAYGQWCTLKSQAMQCEPSTYYSIGGRFASELYPYGQNAENNIENLKVLFYDSDAKFISAYTVFEHELSTWNAATGGFTTPSNSSLMTIERCGMIGGYGLQPGTTLNILTDYIYIKKGGNTTWSPHKSEIYNNITRIDDLGIEVKHEQGSYSRLNSKEFHQSNENGDRTISIRNGGLRTYQFRNEGNGASAFLGGISSTRNNGSDRVYGNTIFGSSNCGYVDIGFSESGEDNQHQNIMPWLRCTHYDGNTGVPHGIHAYKSLYVRNWSYFYYRPQMFYGMDFPYEGRDDLNDEKSFISTSGNPSPGTRKLYVCGADGVQLLVQNMGDKIGHQIIEEGSQVGLYHQAWGNWDMNGWSINNVRVTYSLSNPIAKLSSKERKFTRESEAIMSTTKLIQDRGEDFTMDGQCIVEIPDDIKYNIGRYDINIVKYGRGDIWVSERTLDYFVVESDNDIKFTWVLEGELLENAYRAATYNKLYNFEEVEENPMSTDNIIETIPASKYATFDDELIQKMLRV